MPVKLGNILRVQKDKAIDARLQPSFINDIIGDLLGPEYIVPLVSYCCDYSVDIHLYFKPYEKI